MSENAVSSEGTCCAFCGAKVPVEQRFCSSACDIADRVPRGEEALPASVELGVAMGVFFLLFNQVLFLALSWLKAGSEDVEMAEKLFVVATVFGPLVFAATTFSAVIVRRKFLLDWGVFAIGLGLVVGGFLRSDGFFSYPFQFSVLLCNLLVLSWLARGFAFRRPVKKAQKPSS